MVAGTEDKQAEAAPATPPETAAAAAGVPDAADEPKSSPSVRFQSQVEEIEPIDSLPEISRETKDLYAGDEREKGSAGVTSEQLKAINTSYDTTQQLQGLRIANFAFEPVSLPASRTVSHEDGSHTTSRQHTPTSNASRSPMLSAVKGQDMQSPPLTPSGTAHADSESKSAGAPVEATSSRGARHGVITPQESSTQDASPTSSRGKSSLQPPSSSEDLPRRAVSASDSQEHATLGSHRKGLFSIGPTTSGSGGTSSGSQPVSRESSASDKTTAQYYSRPFTPSGDVNDPYAADKRQPQNKIEPRFVFSRFGRKKEVSPSSSSTAMSKLKDDKRHSGMFGGHHHKRDKEKDDSTIQHEDSSSTTNLHSRPGSMSDLKRFFKLGPSHHHKIKRAVSPAVSVRSARNNAASRSNVQIPFGDEHSLTSKYGKLGKVLGSGAGGSVRLMKRSEDNTVFAVKEFRARHNYESEKEYVKKLTAEYCMGSSLHHGNIIETLDIIRDKTKWYEVMEYAPYDLFAIVMTGRMTRPEITCCFLQILSGVTYLHSMGLAHRDLKLDNVVVSEYGIMKIIDFGSAHVFRYPFESGIVMATGIVGSDPYLAPEVYDERKYDPTAVDIWSLAIIYCCMTLRRFPWKVPRLTDNSYKLFASEPSPGHDPTKLTLVRNKSPSDLPKNEEAEKKDNKDDKKEVDGTNGKDGQASKDGKDDKKETGTNGNNEASAAKSVDKSVDKSGDKPGDKPGDKSGDKPAEKREIIKGPWRILRLLPRESRHIIGGMLKIDPKERIKMDDLIKDPWVANTVICRQVEPGKVIRASNHSHVLEPPTPAMK